jgi:hypothetical protein
VTLPPLVGRGLSTEVVTGTSTAPGGQVVYVIKAASPVVVGDAVPSPEGVNVSAYPSRVSVVASVKPTGTVKVSAPIIMSPEVDTTPAGNVRGNVGTSVVKIVVVAVGANVSANPSRVSVVASVKPTGTVKVSAPIIISPEVETTPAGKVRGNVGTSVVEVVVVVPTDVGLLSWPPDGPNVSGIPSKVMVVDCVRSVGIVKLSPPIKTRPEDDDTPLGKVCTVKALGTSVSVEPSVVSVVGVVTQGMVTLSVPIMTTVTLVVEEGPVESGVVDCAVVDWTSVVPVVATDVGDRTKVWLKVVTVVTVLRGGIVNVLVPMMTRLPLDTMVCPFGAVHVEAGC